MLCVFAINYRLSKRTKSSSLKSAAKDNLSDSLVSIGTAIGLLFTQIGFNYRYYIGKYRFINRVYRFWNFKESILRQVMVSMNKI